MQCGEPAVRAVTVRSDWSHRAPAKDADDESGADAEQDGGCRQDE